jgi:hypothetical protein
MAVCQRCMIQKNLREIETQAENRQAKDSTKSHRKWGITYVL